MNALFNYPSGMYSPVNGKYYGIGYSSEGATWIAPNGEYIGASSDAELGIAK